MNRLIFIFVILAFSIPAGAQQGTWVRLAPAGEARQEVAVAELNGKIYLIGGLRASDVANTVEVYDPAIDRWSFVSPLPEPLHHSSAVSLNGKLYVIGGYNTRSFAPVSSAYSYDPVTDEWTAIASLPAKRGALASVVIDNKIYAVGGEGASVTGELTVYDPVSNSWSQLTAMPTPREHLAAGAINGRLYAVGGRSSRSFTLNILEEYDPVTNSWRARAPMPTGRSGIAGAVLDGRLYVFGGEGNLSSATGTFAQNESYDPLTNTWRAELLMPTPRHGIGAAALDGCIFIPAGGPVQGFSRTNINEAFIPPANGSGLRITTFLPAGAPVGTSISIAGTDLSGVTAVDFNGIGATFNIVSPTLIIAVVPFGATTGRINISRENESASSKFGFRVLPKITGFMPASALPLESITIAGTNLDGATAVKFGALSATFSVISYSEIMAVVPSNALTGPVSVTTLDGTATASLIIIKPPTISSIVPSIGAAGTSVTINGTNLSSVTEVKFNNESAGAPAIISPNSIRTIVPPGATTGKISVENRAGAIQSIAVFRVLPKITDFMPRSGLPGESVTISGTNLGNSPVVRFGSVMAPITSTSATVIVATIPPTAITGRISVVTRDGTTTSLDTFTVIRPPVISTFTPAAGVIGASVTISGGNLSSVTEVRFGDVSAGVPIVITVSSIRTTVPAGAVTGKITVINRASPQGVTSAGIFKILPKINGFSPTSALPEETITINGLSFTGATSVRFGSIAATFTVDSDTEITVTIPKTAVTGRIAITTPGGTGLSTNNFTVIRQPAISSFTPTSGRAGAVVTIFGTNLSSVTDVRFKSLDGEVSAGPITIVSLTSIRVNVPAEAVSGKIAVINRAGMATSAGTFTVLR